MGEENSTPTDRFMKARGCAEESPGNGHNPTGVVAGACDDVTVIAVLAGGGIEPSPAELREVDFGPGMGRAAGGAGGGAIEVAAGKAGRDAEVTEGLDHESGHVATGAAAQREGCGRRSTALLIPALVSDPFDERFSVILSTKAFALAKSPGFGNC